jgi:predicted phage tail protein
MLTVRLHGFLGQKYGEEHALHVTSLGEVLRAFDANYDDFSNEFSKDLREYRIVLNNGKDLADYNFTNTTLPDNYEIDIVPVTKGSKSSVFNIIIGVILIVVGVLLQPTPFKPLGDALISVGIALVVSGISLLLSPPITPSESFAEKSNSRTFFGAANVTGQGQPVPVGYGRVIIGSHVISATLLSSEERAATAHVFKDTNNNSAITIVYKPKEGFWGLTPIFTMSQLWTDDDLGILDSTAEEEWIDGFSGSNYTVDLVYPDYSYLTYSFY